MKRMVKTVIFDLDGVLVDTGEDMANAANFMLRALGLEEVPTAKFISYIGGGMEDVVRKCLGDEAERLFGQAMTIYKERYAQYCLEQTKVYPGMRQVLAALQSSGIEMAVATNKMEGLTGKILRGMQIDGYFQLIVGPESVTSRKPDPEAIILILDKLRAAPERTLMVGDACTDIMAAKAAQILSCGVFYGFGRAEEIRSAGPNFVIDKPEELTSLLGLAPIGSPL